MLVHIHMAIAVEVLDHRHLSGVGRDALNQALPPRGMMTSMYSGRVIISPTAARSVVSITCTAVSGNLAALRPASMQPAIA